MTMLMAKLKRESGKNGRRPAVAAPCAKDAQRLRQTGFALFYSVLVISVLLTVGLKILDIALKEQALSSSARESMIAFYAADSATECALFLDVKVGGVFAVPGGGSAPTAPADRLKCGGQNISVSYGIAAPSCDRSSECRKSGFEYSFGGGSAFVIVEKFDSDTDKNYRTVIEARGYNVPAGVSSPKKVERGVLTVYGDDQ